ncbi:hypothetical protein CYMTET_15008 [Cymbomonas tetramitiformis]|uniref:Ion transport domain-containing protein n=1 Tax=Cymbomonas tetramitiformis TaxID=36881 RepID=A0AAE0GEW5_9CHLO|nr:hypothetical protein CYMTET_15008 [Cymbomonas tetramitiformis]
MYQETSQDEVGLKQVHLKVNGEPDPFPMLHSPMQTVFQKPEDEYSSYIAKMEEQLLSYSYSKYAKVRKSTGNHAVDAEQQTDQSFLLDLALGTTRHIAGSEAEEDALTLRTSRTGFSTRLASRLSTPASTLPESPRTDSLPGSAQGSRPPSAPDTGKPKEGEKTEGKEAVSGTPKAAFLVLDDIYWPRRVRKFCDSRVFLFIITAAIFAASALTGYMTYEVNLLTELADYLLTLVFSIEVGLKIFSSGPMYPNEEEWALLELKGAQAGVDRYLVEQDPSMYFQDPWNVFDFVVTVACWCPFGPVVVLRVMRLFRMTKLVKNVKKLQLLILSMVKSLGSLVYITMFSTLLGYIFAIVGMFFFRENDPTHYRNLSVAMQTILRISTLEDWTDLMYIEMFGCNVMGYIAECTEPSLLDGATVERDENWPCPETCFENCCGAEGNVPTGYYWGSVWYHFAVVILMALVMVSLFTGVLVNSIMESMEEQKAKMAAEKDNRLADKSFEHALTEEQISKINNVIGGLGDMYIDEDTFTAPPWTVNLGLSEPANARLTWYCLQCKKLDVFVNNNSTFANVVMAAIIGSAVLVGLNTVDEYVGHPVIEGFEMIVTVIFMVEVIIKLLATVRVVRVFQRVPQLQIIVSGLLMGMGSMLYTIILFCLLLYMFAILGIYLFKENDPWHFTGIMNTIVTLFRCATGDDWTDLMYTQQYGCDKYPLGSLEPGSGYYDLTGDKCDQPKAWGFISGVYFVSLITLANFTLMSLFVGAVCNGMLEANSFIKSKKQMDTECALVVSVCKLSPKIVDTLREIFFIIDDDRSAALLIPEFCCVLKLCFGRTIVEGDLKVLVTDIFKEPYDTPFGIVNFLITICILEHVVDESILMDIMTATQVMKAVTKFKKSTGDDDRERRASITVVGLDDSASNVGSAQNEKGKLRSLLKKMVTWRETVEKLEAERKEEEQMEAETARQSKRTSKGGFLDQGLGLLGASVDITSPKAPKIGLDKIKDMDVVTSMKAADHAKEGAKLLDASVGKAGGALGDIADSVTGTTSGTMGSMGNVGHALGDKVNAIGGKMNSATAHMTSATDQISGAIGGGMSSLGGFLGGAKNAK